MQDRAGRRNIHVSSNRNYLFCIGSNVFGFFSIKHRSTGVVPEVDCYAYNVALSEDVKDGFLFSGNFGILQYIGSISPIYLQGIIFLMTA